MLSKRPRKLVSMIIEHQAIALAEVIVGRSPRVIRHDRFELPAGLSCDTPEVLGKAVADFLRKNRYASKHVIIGLPSRWTLLKSKTLPPSNAAAATAMLRLAIEREYHDSARDWTFDYLTQSSDSQGVNVLLAAAPRNRLNQLHKMAQVAGLAIVAIVPAKLTIAAATLQQQDAATLHLSDQGSEVVIWKAGRLVAMERLVQPVEAQALFAAELRRILAVHGVKPEEIHLQDTRTTTGAQPATAWQSTMESPVVAIQPAGDSAGPAADLAILWHKHLANLIDFEHSRLRVAAPSRFTRLHMIGSGVALVILLCAGYLTLDWYLQWRAVNDLQQQMAAMKSELVTARADVNRLTHARGWYDNRPAMLNGIRALTLAFPTQGQVWTTSLIMRDDLTGTLAAKAEDEKAAINLIEKLRSTPGFTEVKMLYLRQADRTSKTVSFALNFIYTGKD